MSLDALVGKYPDIFTCLEGGNYKLPVNATILCLDAEWHEVGGKNNVLSYQVAALTRTAANNVVHYMDREQRLSLAEVVEAGIRSVNDGQIPASYRSSRNLIHLVAHHVTAEWSVLRDRKEAYIVKNLMVIRKSPVTGRNLIEVMIGDGVRCLVRIVDSRLLAPAGFQSLKKLTMLLDSDDQKRDIPHYWKKRMHRFRQQHRHRFDDYSLQDTASTLKVYLLLLDSLIDLAGKGRERGKATIFRTLASGAVTGFLSSYPAFDQYVKRMREPEYAEVMRLFRRGYHGGRNEGFLIGRTDRLKELDGRLWCDIDFCGCYPSAMALCPSIANGIDPLAQPELVEGAGPGQRRRRVLNAERPRLPVRYHALVYRLTDRADAEILKEGIAPANYHRVKRVLDELNAIADGVPQKLARDLDEAEIKEIEADLYRQRVTKYKEFDRELARIRLEDKRDAEIEGLDSDVLRRLRGTRGGRAQAQRIRELAVTVDNTLVNEWYRRWRRADRAGDASVEQAMVAGVARVKFRFPDRRLYPCLPMSHPAYGLIFPLEGECVATAIEIVTAMAAGAKIEAICSVELPVTRDPETGAVQRPFFQQLKMLIERRNEFKAQMNDGTLPAEVRQRAKVLEQLTKESSNSFYGKTAQGIRHRRSYGPGTGEMSTLGPSQISEACAGALTTGLARAALGAVLLAIERYNRWRPPAEQILVASATTDGLLVGLPRPGGEFRTAGCYQWNKEEGNRDVTDHLKRGEVRLAGIEPRPNKGEQVKGLELRKPFTKIETILEQCGCQGLMDEMLKFLAIRQMRNARRELTDDATFLEVKNLADHAAFVKTRGQLGWIDYQSPRRSFYREGRAFTISAKFGLKPPLSDIVADGIDVATLPESRVMRLEQRYARLLEGPDTDRNTVEGSWVLQQLDRLRDEDQQATPIIYYNFYTLRGFNELVKCEDDELDLVQKVTDRQLNADYDWKRRLELDGDGRVSPFSKPYRDISDMLVHRGQMQAERYWGRNALPEAVLHRVQVRGRRTSTQGGEAAAVVRLFLRLMVSKKHLPGARLGARVPARLNAVWESEVLTMQAMRLKKKVKVGEEAKVPRRVKARWTTNDVKNAKKAVARIDAIELRVIRPTLPLLKLVDALAATFRVDADKVKGLIFSAPLDEEMNPALAALVARAVLHGPRRGLEPFRTLYLNGDLPNQAGLVRTLHPHLTTAMAAACAQGDFHPGEGGRWDRPRLAMLFRRLGLTPDEAESCARVVVLPGRVKQKLPANPARQRCLESFVHALHQRDIVPRSIGATVVLDRLQPFGLKRHRYFALRHSKFSPRCLSDSAGNRRQIARMAKRLELDPTPLLEALLDK